MAVLILACLLVWFIRLSPLRGKYKVDGKYSHMLHVACTPPPTYDKGVWHSTASSKFSLHVASVWFDLCCAAPWWADVCFWTANTFDFFILVRFDKCLSLAWSHYIVMSLYYDVITLWCHYITMSLHYDVIACDTWRGTESSAHFPILFSNAFY